MLKIILSSVLVLLAGIAHAQNPECNRLCSRDFMFSLDSGFDVIPLAADGEHANGYMEDGRTPLIWAALDPDDEDALYFTDALIFAGGDVNTPDKQARNTPLHWHILRDGGANADVVALYIQEGADVLAKNKQGHSPFDYVNGGVYETVIVTDEVYDLINDEAERRKAYHFAYELYQNGIFDHAVNHFRALAEGGYLQAQYSLARMLEAPETDEITQDIDEALYWYEEAANSGHVESMFHLGSSALNGTSTIQKDYAVANEWLSLGARNGDVKSQTLLGLMHANGKGVDADLKKAMMWILISLRFGVDHEDKADLLNKIAAALPYEDVKQAEYMAKECIMGFFEHC